MSTQAAMERRWIGGVAGRVLKRGLLGAALLWLPGGAARADLTLVSRVTLTANGRSAPARELVTYFKGGRLRSDTGSVATIYDTAADQIIRIDRSRKTYTVISQKQRSRSASALAGLRFKTTASVRPGGKSRVITGRKARNYVADASVQIQLPGYPGAAPTTRMRIEQWTTDAVQVPAAARRALALASAGFGVSMTTGMKPLAGALGRIPGLPLSSKVTMDTARPGSTGGSVTSLTEVRSIQTGDLNEDLFRVPRGYRKVDPPGVARYARRFQTPPQSLH